MGWTLWPNKTGGQIHQSWDQGKPSHDRLQGKTFPCHTDKVMISKVLGYLKEQGLKRPSSMMTQYKWDCFFWLIKVVINRVVWLLKESGQGRPWSIMTEY